MQRGRKKNEKENLRNKITQRHLFEHFVCNNTDFRAIDSDVIEICCLFSTYVHTHVCVCVLLCIYTYANTDRCRRNREN